MAQAADVDRPDSPPWWRRAELISAATAIICFVNVLPNDFCYDDILIVRDNPRVTEPGEWDDIWFEDHWAHTAAATPNRDLLYRPVVLSSYRLVWAMVGDQPWLQHLVNVLLYAATCAAVARLARYISGGETAAFLAGVLFAVLPIHTEVVASVVGRADLLATLGIIAALLCHRHSVYGFATRFSPHDERTARPRTGATNAGWFAPTVAWRVAGALAAFVAMGSKESGLAVVPVIVLFDLLLNGQGQRVPANGLRHRRLSWTTAGRLPYLLPPLALYVGLRLYALEGRFYQEPPLTKTVNVLVDSSVWQQVLGVIQLWGMYWAKTIWPSVLSIKYSVNAIRLATDIGDVHVLIGVTAALVLVVASIIAWMRGHRSVAFLTCSLVMSYLPTSNALVLMRVFFAERIWFLPSVFAAMLAGLAGASLMEHVARRSTAVSPNSEVHVSRADASWRTMMRVALALLLVTMTIRCWLRNAEWRNNGTLFAAAYRDQPDGAGPLQLYGQWLVAHGELERGTGLIRQAIAIDIGFTDAWRSLADAHVRQGNWSAALQDLRVVRMQVPDDPNVAAALKRLSETAGKDDELLGRLRAEADAQPANLNAELALIRRLRELGLTEAAIERLRSNEQRFGTSASWQAEYAVTLVYLDARDAAIDRYVESLRLDPENAQRAVELAMLFLERRGDGDIDRAAYWAEHASRRAPDSVPVLVCQAEIAVARKDRTAAVRGYRRAIEKMSEHDAMRRVYEERVRELGG